MAPIIDIFDFVVSQGNGVKGLADTGINTLPDRYILSPVDRLDPAKIATESSIPVIDVSNWTDPVVSDSICAAARNWGFFQIVNHGIPSEILEKVKNAGHRFFDLPNEERRKYLKGKSPSEMVSLMTSFSPNSEAVLEWKDFLSFNFAAAGGGDHDSSALWPPVCKDEVLEYKGKADIVIRKLLEVLLKGLNVENISKEMESALIGSEVINFTYYPKCPNPELAAGIRPHSDISTITILLQDNTGGLYVRGGEKNDCWIHVSPIDGALVINIGDVLQIMSNDKYKSIEHRVVANREKNRISVPIFVDLAPDASFGPLPEALEDGEKAVYKEVVCSDYYKYFFSKAHDGKKTLEYAKI